MVAKRDKLIAVVGVSEEETAHLRLLLRMAAAQLKYRWRWGSEEAADVVVVDPQTFAGQLARNRVHAAGARCAVLVPAEDAMDAALVLRRPLKLPGFLAMMRQVEDALGGGLELAPMADDFYFREDAEPAPAALPAERGGVPGPRAPKVAEPAAHGLDEVLKHDPASDRPAFAVPMRLDEGTRIEGGTGDSRRRESRQLDKQIALGGSRVRKAGDEAGAASGEELPPGHALRAFLGGELLRGPSRIRLDGAPALTLDPKHRVFFANGGLRALEPYCRARLALHAWQAVTTADLAQLRAGDPARPYEELVWLDRLLAGGGHLARHLDPGGTYRLARRVDTGTDYPVQARIAAAMEKPSRLHEIAAAAKAAMPEVFDTINAYEAIGWLEWQPRRPRHAESGNQVPRSGLLAKLGLPFRRK